MKRGILTIGIIAVVVGLIAWILINNKKENEARTAIVADESGAIVVKTAVAEKQSLQLDFSVNGNFAAKQDLDLLAETNGRVTQLLVDEGDQVRKGQTLIKIDPEYANLDLQQAEAG